MKRGKKYFLSNNMKHAYGKGEFKKRMKENRFFFTNNFWWNDKNIE